MSFPPPLSCYSTVLRLFLSSLLSSIPSPASSPLLLSTLLCHKAQHVICRRHPQVISLRFYIQLLHHTILTQHGEAFQARNTQQVAPQPRRFHKSTFLIREETHLGTGPKALTPRLHDKRVVRRNADNPIQLPLGHQLLFLLNVPGHVT